MTTESQKGHTAPMNAVDATLERIEDSYVLIAEGVPIFDAHAEPVSEDEAKRKPAWTRKKGDGWVRDFDRDALEEIVANCNASDEAGNPCLFGPGHTIPDRYDDDGNLVEKTPETKQPPPWGVYRNFRVADHNGKPHILCDQYAHPDHAGEALTYPNRSVELWLTDRDINYVALLRRRGKRDLGVVMHKRSELKGDCLRYEMDGDAPTDDVAAPADPTTQPPEADTPSEDEYMSFMRCMKRYEAENAPPPAPAPMPAPPPGPGAPPMPEPAPAPAPFQRRERPSTYERRLAAMEKQLADRDREVRVMRYERELTALRDEDGYEIDVQAELKDVADMTPEQFSRHMERIQKNYKQAPVGRDMVHLARTPESGRAPRDTDEISERHALDARRYMRKHGCGLDEAIEKTRRA